MEYLGYLVDAAQRMRTMIYGLLNLSRAGKVTGEFGPIPLRELIGQVTFELGALIRSRDAIVEDLSPEVVLWGDGRRLHQLLANLVSNAIKYNRSDPPRVEIGVVEPACGRVEEEDHDPDRVLTFFVRDNGIGIDPRFHDIIFQPFRRLHAPDEFEGTGVGLAICSKIVQAHGGQHPRRECSRPGGHVLRQSPAGTTCRRTRGTSGIRRSCLSRDREWLIA